MYSQGCGPGSELNCRIGIELIIFDPITQLQIKCTYNWHQKVKKVINIGAERLVLFCFKLFGSVVDPELFIPDPALNFPSSGSRKTICHLLYYTTVLQYTKSRIYREITFLFIWSIIFCRIRNNNSWSRQKFRIHADPDPQHCFLECFLFHLRFTLPVSFLKQFDSI